MVLDSLSFLTLIDKLHHSTWTGRAKQLCERLCIGKTGYRITSRLSYVQIGILEFEKLKTQGYESNKYEIR